MIDQDRLDGLLDQWEDLREQGDEPSVAELCSDDSELAEELRSQIQELKKTDWIFESDDDDCEFLTVPPLDTLVQQAILTVAIPASVSMDEFASSIVTSGLMTGEQLSKFQDRSNVKNAQGLVDGLIREKKLTPYQAKAGQVKIRY